MELKEKKYGEHLLKVRVRYSVSFLKHISLFKILIPLKYSLKFVRNNSKKFVVPSNHRVIIILHSFILVFQGSLAS